jgi:hypothetical protein
MSAGAAPLWISLLLTSDGGAFRTDAIGAPDVRARRFRAIVQAIVTAGHEAWEALLLALPLTPCPEACGQDHLYFYIWPDGADEVALDATDRVTFARRTFSAFRTLLEEPTALDCAADYHLHDKTSACR